MDYSKLDIVILAAGKGTRMRSNRAKVLHEVAGRPMLTHVLDTVRALAPRNIAVVVGHQADAVQAAIEGEVIWVEQTEQLGTGHAVQQAMANLPGDGSVIVLYGDVPLVSEATVRACADAALGEHTGLVIARFEDPAELGRIVRDANGGITEIVEYKDADDAVRAIDEINSGIVAATTANMNRWLSQVQPNNNQGEYYLTDIIAMSVADGVQVVGVEAASPAEVTGVNDRVQLAEIERIYQRREAERLMRAGVTIADPERVDIRGTVTTGDDCFIDINVVLEGEVSLGRGVTIGPGAMVIDSTLGDDVAVHAHTVVEGATLARDVSVGPFARIRPGSILDDGVKIGNFVETKKSHLGAGTKASHLAYLGDATIGKNCNIGAGSVTCNYDGIEKHPTTIGDEVFVGTNSTMVAPLVVEDGAFLAAGSTITSKVGKGDLAVGRGKQRNIQGWTRPDKRK